MGTSNFWSSINNTAYMYNLNDEFDFEDVVSYIANQLNVKYGEDKVWDCINHPKKLYISPYGGYRDSDAVLITEVDFYLPAWLKWDTYDTEDVLFRVQVFAKAGYYEGVQFDYRVVLELSDTVCQEIDFDDYIDNFLFQTKASYEETNQRYIDALEKRILKQDDKFGKVWEKIVERLEEWNKELEQCIE